MTSIYAVQGPANTPSSFLGQSPNATSLRPARRARCDAPQRNWCLTPITPPNQANGCGAAYDAVVYWPLKCDAVAAKQFASLKKVGQLKKDISVLDGGVATKVFLMPAGSGCVSIKKEVVL